MTAQLPSASSRVVRTGTGVATGLNLATIWGCCSLNADMVPRLWFDSGALEDFHGPGQLLDHVSTFIAITGLPVLVVPLPINAEGIIRTQLQSGTGTSAATMATDTDGSLERVDGLQRVARGGTVGVDQIQMEYSLDGGNRWTLYRLGTATSYTIPRTGQIVNFSAGTLVTGEEILAWTSSAPEPADADIATARVNLAAQNEQSRAWFLVRELIKEQDVAAYAAAVAAYDTTDERPLQAYAGIRRAYDRSGYKAQMSQIRNRMQGEPEITFTNATSLIERDAGDFGADGFEDGDWVSVAGAPLNSGPKLVGTVAALSLTISSPALVDEGPIENVTIYAAPGLTFSDASDTLVRNRGSWLDDGFAVGDVITIAGSGGVTPANAGEYTIIGVTASTITVAADSFVDEERSSWGISITVSVSYPVDVAAMDAAFSTVTNQYKLELFYGQLWRQSPAVQMRLRYSTALADMARSFLRDLSETTYEKGYGSLAGDEGWGMIDTDGQPFEYDERVHRAALPAGFSCARTWASDSASIPYIARTLTRAGGSDALTQAEKARPTNLGRIIVQRQTENLTGAVFVKQPPDDLGRQFLTADALGTVEAKVNKELARQMLGKTRSNVGPRVSRVSWVASRDDDFAVQNPRLTGKLTVDTLGVIITVDTTVEVI